VQIHLFEPARLFADAIADVLGERGHHVDHLPVVVDVERGTVVAPQVADGGTYVVAASGPDLTLALALTTAVAPGDVVVVLESTATAADAAAADAAGARAVLTKAAPLHVLVSVIEGAPAPPLRRYQPRPHRSGPTRLTAREREVLEALVAGAGTPILAAQLGVSTATARTHVQNLLTKLGAHSRIEAVAIAVDLGIVGVRQARVS
jgi:two-component system nitrate/nitrite response regulator NarL